MENQSEETPLNPETFVIGKNGIPVQLKTAFALFLQQIFTELVLSLPKILLESDKPSSSLCKYASHKITKFDSSNTMIKTWIIIQ